MKTLKKLLLMTAFLLGMAVVGPAQNQKISQLPNGNPAQAGDLIPIARPSCPNGNCTITPGSILSSLPAGSLINAMYPANSPIVIHFAGTSGTNQNLIDFVNDSTGRIFRMSMNSQNFNPGPVLNDAFTMGFNTLQGGGCINPLMACIYDQWNSSFEYSGSQTVERQMSVFNVGGSSGQLGFMNFNFNGTTGLDNFENWYANNGQAFFCLTTGCSVGSVSNPYFSISPTGSGTGFSVPLQSGGELSVNTGGGGHGFTLIGNVGVFNTQFLGSAIPSNCASNASTQVIYVANYGANSDKWYWCPISSTAPPTLFGTTAINQFGLFGNQVAVGTGIDLIPPGGTGTWSRYFMGGTTSSGIFHLGLVSGTSVYDKTYYSGSGNSGITNTNLGSVVSPVTFGDSNGTLWDSTTASGSVNFAAALYEGGTAGVTGASCLGAVAAKGGLVTTCTAVSDQRLKTRFKPYPYGLEAIMKLHPSLFHYNEKGQELTGITSEQSGFIAQDVQTAIPEAVGTETHDGIDYLSLPQGDRPIVAALVNAVQEQQKEIEELKAEIKALREKK